MNWRPIEPQPSGRVVVVEIDECSIEHFRARGEGGWPWSRQRHADLLDRLDREGVRAAGYDVLLTDPSREDPGGDQALEAMALGGEGRFLFAAARMHRDYDAGAPLLASQAPGAFPLVDEPAADPRVALLLPYGDAMAAASAIVNVARDDDGVLRDLPVYEAAGDWGLPSLPMRLAVTATGKPPREFAPSVRPNWRENTRLPRLSAADLLVEGPPVCRRATGALPKLKDAVVLVGYTAAGLNDAKPTPVDPVMPGVEVLAEATEALVAGSAIRVPPAWLKYAIAALLVALTAFVFFRGEPHNDIDSIFVATNVAAARRGLHRAHVLRVLLRRLRRRRLREPRVRPVPHLRQDPARPRGRQRRLPAGLRPREGPLARGRAPAFRAGRRARRAGRSCGAAASIAGGCGASCTLAPTP